jgi:transposase
MATSHFKNLREPATLMLMSTTELIDRQWQRVEPLLPSHKDRGRPRAYDRKTLNGILYVLRTGCRWQDIPREYGSATTCWRRLKQWEKDGTWERIWRSLLVLLDDQGNLEWTRAFLDGSFVPAKKGGTA